ncbi:Cellobiose dehydrogenase [Fulvia fulva]|uniref:Cellobiose dehydrogenase n=1 Tax=Passalora fulva TaxID=5499 RepID=A0A1P8YXR8_PASFU|nr:Cellobiose dehydrogenase [Fulvia fulva]AQA29310.1 hypothetical protein 17 [Fulvia fulva]KAK4609460.1 Cellobiose dehydrogenase [Fulvia fulva]KAK4609705.1 Cellobiose dehydrogenase [Fulvia fulva]UJO24912.1 Cellobiose dehydrogenase [Fulvia fulva]WPV22517.1 Cellobiose dehydrogenase [Fulvia fulva]
MKVNTTVLLSLAVATVSALPAGSPAPEDAWDVIVVGAGPAGIVVADRLSEAGKKTLLLEQGGPSYYITGGRERPGWLNDTDLSRVDVPGLYKSIYSNPSDDLLCPAEKLNSYGACTIGGCTAINAGLWFQPPATDFDRYFPDSWKSEDMQCAIDKVRKQQPYTSDPRTNGTAVSGYYAAKKWLVDGAGYKDVEFNDVPNEKVKTWGRPEFMYENGQRSGPVKTYLQSSLKRSNFKFQSGVQVKRVVRDGAKATGVDVTIDGKDSAISLSPKGGRVILSGGALFSPQLLMLSGIGDTAVLQNLSTHGLLKTDSKTWIENKAVGAGLFDNPNTFIELSGPSVTSYVYNYTDPVPADRDAYLKDRQGPYAFASETSAFWNEYKYPNGDAVGVQGTIDSSGFGEYMEDDTITLNIYGTSGMRSLGKVALNMTTGAPGQEKPFFYTDSEGQDADAIASFIHDIFASLPKSGLTPRNIPADASKEEIKKYITTASQYTLGNVNHWSSSCRLGECVDTNTVVKGTENLHVVDASIVPPLTTNPSFGVVIAAERAAEVILALKA